MKRPWTLGPLVAALAFTVDGHARQPQPSFVVSDAVVAEGAGGFTSASFTVTIANPNTVESRVHYLTSDGSASANAGTFTSSGGISIPVAGNGQPYPQTVTVSGLAGTIEHVAVRLNQLTHTFSADLDLLLVAPGGQRAIVMSDVGGFEDVLDVSPTFQDGAPAPTRPLGSGTYAPTDFDPGDTLPAPAPPRPYNTSFSAFNGTDPNGTWSLYVHDDQSADGGSIGSVSLIITTTGAGGDYLPSAGLLRFPPGTPALTVQIPVRGDALVEPDESFGLTLLAPFNATIADGQAVGTILNDDGTVPAQPPTAFRVVSIVGNLVTFQWRPPLVGPAPTNYLIEGGTGPSSIMASLPTGSAAPTFTLAVPPGSFYVRLHTLAGSARSAASNEILIHVGVPVPPSAPTNLIGVVGTSRLALAWQNTFLGGAPTTLVLDVAGPITTSVPVGLTDSFAYNPVPAGTYTFAVRAVNAAGASVPSNPVTLSFPSTCFGVLQPPAEFTAYRIGSLVTVLWNHPLVGPAPTGYVLTVAGTFNGSLSTGSRTLSGIVGPGTYTLTAQAVHYCGLGLSTAPVTLNVP